MKKIVLLVITIAIALFIFINSILSADDSSTESGFILTIAESIISFLHIPDMLTETIIRKLAHFTEFAGLGLFLSLTVHEWYGTFRGQIFKILFLLLSAPVIDETIQYFPVGRSSEVRDVLIDFSGAIIGLVIALLIYIVKEKRKEKKHSDKNI